MMCTRAHIAHVVVNHLLAKPRKEH